MREQMKSTQKFSEKTNCGFCSGRRLSKSQKVCRGKKNIMQVELSEREIELIIHMLTEEVSKVNDGKVKLNFSVDEVILLEKLDQALKLKDIDNVLENKDTQKTKYLN